LASAILKTICSTPAWVSFRLSMRPISSGPMSVIGGAHRVALFAEHVPQRGRAGERLGLGQAALLDGRGQLAFQLARLADAGQVALDVGQEHRHPDLAEAFRQLLQGDGLAGAGGARHETVPVGHRGQQEGLGLALLGDQHRFGHGAKSRMEGRQ
jgi:hypothetical protein